MSAEFNGNDIQTKDLVRRENNIRFLSKVSLGALITELLLGFPAILMYENKPMVFGAYVTVVSATAFTYGALSHRLNTCMGK